MRSLIFAGFALFVFTAPSIAAPADPADVAKPAVIVRVKPIDELFADLKALEPVTNFPFGGPIDGEKLLSQYVGEGWDEAIDRTKPLGVIGDVAAPLENSTAVALVPVKDEKKAVKLLEKYAEVKRTGNGGYTFEVLAVSVYLKFVGGYAAISAMHAEPLAKVKVGTAADVLKGDRPAGWLSVSIDGERIPKEVRELALEKIAELEKYRLPGEEITPAIGAIFRQYRDLGVEFGTLLARDTRRVDLDIDFNRKTGEATADFTLSGQPASELAKRIAAPYPTKSRTAGLMRDDDAARYTAFITYPKQMNLAAIESYRFMSEEKFNPSPEGRAIARFTAIYHECRPTTDDLSAVLRGPNKDGQFTVVAAAVMKDTNKLEKAFKTFVGEAPEANKPFLKGLKFADKADADGMKLHYLTLPEEDPTVGIARKAFGKGPVLVGVLPDLIVAAYGPDAEAAIQEAKSLKPTAASVSTVEANPAAIATLLKHFGIEAKGEKGRIHIITQTLEGGKQLHYRATSDVLGIVRLIRMTNPTQ